MSIPVAHDRLPVVNPGEPHIACVLLVDNSQSMNGAPIRELNQGLIEFGEALQQDSLALGRAEVSVISFNSSVNTEVGFRPATEYEAPTLTASGLTSMNAAFEAGLDALEARKAEYRAQGVRYYRPWLFVLTDGAPTDGALEGKAMARLRSAIQNKKVVYLPMGIGTNADTAKLQSYYPEDATNRPVLKASASNFREAFQWLSASIAEVCNSNPDVTTEVQTPPVPSTIVLGI